MTLNEALKIFEQCGEKQISDALLQSVTKLFAEDIYLLQKGVNERTVTGRLAHYLEPHFEGWKVEAEYNRDGDDTKKLAWKSEIEDRIYPDIIVHKRGRGVERNWLTIEVKTAAQASKDDDLAKLRGMKRRYGYDHALFMHFGTDDEAGTFIVCEWA